MIADFNAFSGDFANQGFTQEAGCVPAVSLINAAGGVLGNKLQCQIVDDRGDPQDAVPAAQKLLATTPNLVAVIDSNSGLLSATSPLFNAQHIPELSLGGDVPFDKNKLPYFWRSIPGDDINGYAVAAYIKDKTSFHKVAGMFSSDQDAQGNVPGFVDGVQKLGLTMVINQSLTPDQPAYNTEISQMVAASPEVMSMESDQKTAGVLYSQMNQAGALLPTVLTAGTDNTDFDAAMQAAIGDAAYKKNFVKLLQYAPSTGPAWEAFDGALKASASQVKDAPTHETDTYSEAAYDNVNMVALAMTAARSVDPKVFSPFIDTITKGSEVVHTYAAGKAALEAGKTISYQGIQGKIVFDQYHNFAGTWGVFEPLTHNMIAQLTSDQVSKAETG